MFYICNEMKRAIFNPQHDMCLADGSGSFIPPAAILEFARKCRWVERFMCGGESCVESGSCEDGGLPAEGGKGAVTSVRAKGIASLNDDNGAGMSEGRKGAVTSIVPWGWNRCLKESLIKEGVPRELLPDDVQLDFIREASRRELALELLEFLNMDGNISGGEEEFPAGYLNGEAEGCRTFEDVDDCVSSGRVQLIPVHYRIAAHSMEEIEEFLQQNADRTGSIKVNNAFGVVGWTCCGAR